MRQSAERNFFNVLGMKRLTDFGSIVIEVCCVFLLYTTPQFTGPFVAFEFLVG